MKTFKLVLFGLLAGFIIYACSPKVNPGTGGSGSTVLIEKLNYIANYWNSMGSQDATKCPSYLPDQGVRIRYFRAQPQLGMTIVEGIVGKKVFLKGPHEGGFNCSSENSFGYYNPAFLNSLQGVLKTTYGNKIFVDNFQATYDAQLKGYLRTFYLSYEAGISDQTIKSEYQKRLTSSKRENFTDAPSTYLQEAFRNHADGLEQQGYDWYEAVTCPAFWLRRSIDGTADEFYALLTLTLEVFDAEFVKS